MKKRSTKSVGISRESVAEEAVELFKEIQALNEDDFEKLQTRCIEMLESGKKPEVAARKMVTYLKGYADCLRDLGEITDGSEIEEDLEIIAENMENERHSWEEPEPDDEDEDEDDY